MEQQAFSLWQLYQQTWFAVPAQRASWPHFAIITAFNPAGVVCTEQQNSVAHEQMCQMLTAWGGGFVEFYAGDKDMQHKELSVAVPLSQDAALALAAEFRQNAIYWVSADQLTLLPVLMEDVQAVDMGTFSSRCLW